MTIGRTNQKEPSEQLHTYAPPQTNAQVKSYKMTVL